METKRGHHALAGEGGSHLPTNDPLSSPKLVYRGGNSGIYVVARNFILLLLCVALPGSCLTRFRNSFLYPLFIGSGPLLPLILAALMGNKWFHPCFINILFDA